MHSEDLRIDPRIDSASIYRHSPSVYLLCIYQDTYTVGLYILMYLIVYSAAWKFVNPLEYSIFLHKYDPKHHHSYKSWK